ncbi:MAG: hypothetical protein AAFQ89_11605 [Cyanobacteria bacterium J06626_18]
MPVLMDVRQKLRDQISVFSGTTFDLEPQKGLEGRCDFLFLLSRSPEQYYITAPVLTIVEAKNDNVPSGLGQCVATMLAASIFNSQKGNPVKTVYGAVTNGNDWKFLQLVDKTVFIDIRNYFINEVDKILGILVYSLQA